MVTRLTIGQKNLLSSLYQETILNNKTPGMFRQHYEDGCSKRLWESEETLRLENNGLINLSHDLLLAGIFCPSLTRTGRRYVGAVA